MICNLIPSLSFFLHHILVIKQQAIALSIHFKACLMTYSEGRIELLVFTLVVF